MRYQEGMKIPELCYNHHEAGTFGLVSVRGDNGSKRVTSAAGLTSTLTGLPESYLHLGSLHNGDILFVIGRVLHLTGPRPGAGGESGKRDTDCYGYSLPSLLAKGT